MEPLPKFGGDATLDAFNESRRKRQRLETARAAAEAAEEAGEEVEPAWIALDEFDLFATLRIPRPHGESIKLSGGDARVRASYHRQAQYYHPTWGSAGMEEKEAELHLRRITLAYLCLKDLERRRIYIAHDWEGLRESEKCCEWSIFEADPYEAYDDFFAGVDPVDREYLLLNGNAHMSDEEGGSDDEDGYLAQEAEVARILAEEEAAKAAAAAAAKVEGEGGGEAASSSTASSSSSSSGGGEATQSKFDRLANVPAMPLPPSGAWLGALQASGSATLRPSADVWAEIAKTARVDAPAVAAGDDDEEEAEEDGEEAEAEAEAEEAD
jgi:hypothetical protein